LKRRNGSSSASKKASNNAEFLLTMPTQAGGRPLYAENVRCWQQRSLEGSDDQLGLPGRVLLRRSRPTCGNSTTGS
jgi:hypothetical protein